MGLFTAGNCEAITAAATVEHCSHRLSITTVALTSLCLEGRAVNWYVITGNPGSGGAVSNILHGK